MEHLFENIVLLLSFTYHFENFQARIGHVDIQISR